MTVFLGILTCSGAALAACYYAHLLGKDSRWRLRWVLQGLVVPCGFWLAINAGLFWNFGPFMPEVSLAQNAGQSGRPLMLYYAGIGMILVASYWLTVSLVWLLAIIWSRSVSEDHKAVLIYILIWVGLSSPVTVTMLGIGGWKLAGFAASLPLLAVVHSSTALARKPKIAGQYSAAVSKLKFGKAAEAEREILKQLEELENDFDGWMLLAELYATQFKDLDAADQTVRDLCAQPDLNAGQVVTALHRLADWHLQIGEDPVAARETLEIICKAYPGTHLARMAQLRTHQLPSSRKDLLAQRHGRTLRLPGLREEAGESQRDAASAGTLVKDLVAQLNANPDDVEARERLAQAYAEGLGRHELGIEQLELLLAMADVPEGKQPRWLSQIASWQLKSQPESETGRNTLKRLITEHPHSVQAFAAQRRLLLMDVERKICRAQTPTP